MQVHRPSSTGSSKFSTEFLEFNLDRASFRFLAKVGRLWSKLNVSSGRKVHAPTCSDKSAQNFRDKNCLSSDVVSITFTYFLNPPYLSLKYSIQFVPIDTPQNRLQRFKKLVFVSHLSPFEFSFTVGNK
jgi:hypothetical protein